MKIVFLIPMKGNSERVKNKNLKKFNGKPLYHWILNSVLKSKFLKYVLINTDSKKIKKDIIDNFDLNKIKIIDRPINLCGDFVSMNKIIDNDLNHTDNDDFFQTHSTNPLLKTSTIDSAINLYFKNKSKYDSLFSVTEFKSRFYCSNSLPINHDPSELIRTQDLNPIYEENSNIYIFSKNSFKNSNKRRIGIKPLTYVMDVTESIDIDTPKDFKIAELLQKINFTKE